MHVSYPLNIHTYLSGTVDDSHITLWQAEEQKTTHEKTLISSQILRITILPINLIAFNVECVEHTKCFLMKSKYAQAGNRVRQMQFKCVKNEG